MGASEGKRPKIENQKMAKTTTTTTTTTGERRAARGKPTGAGTDGDDDDARDVVLSLAARAILSGADGVTAREVRRMLDDATCVRTKGKAARGGKSDGAGWMTEERVFEILSTAVERNDWIKRAASEEEATSPASRGGETGRIVGTAGRGGEVKGKKDAIRSTVFDFAGREYRPPRSWLGSARGGGKSSSAKRKRAPHSSVRDVLRMCNVTATDVDGDSSGVAHPEAAASPEKRKQSKPVNVLLDLEEKDKKKREERAALAAAGGKKSGAKKPPKARKKKDLANEKAGDHLALVKWIGDGKKDGVRNDRTFYDGFKRDGVTYKRGDCIYCLPEHTSEDMYLAQIQRCFQDEGGSMMMECCWFMTQDEVRAWGGVLSPDTPPEEIFLGTSVDVNPIAALEGHVNVLTYADFVSSASTAAAAAKNNSDSVDRMRFARKCYVPTHGYDPKSKKSAHRKPGVFVDLRRDPSTGFVVQWPAEKSRSKTSKVKRKKSSR